MFNLWPKLDDAPAPVLPARVPVTVLTGFLGSGKTTLLNRLLRLPDLRGTAVIINEFGAVGLDHDLVAHTDEQMVLLSNGCICCTIRGDLVGALERLAADPGAQAGQLKHVVLETTGLADPAPILHTLMGDARLAANWRLAGVATTVDAVNGAATLDRQPEAVKQVAVADHLLLSKTDLADAATLGPLRERLHHINPAAWLSETADSNLQALQGLLDAAPVNPVLSTIAGNRALALRPLPGADHDPNRHDDHICSYALVRDTPLPREGFFAWLDMVARLRGNDLLRVKGLVHLDDSPDRPLVIHGVQHVFHPPEWLPAWPSDDRRTRIVFITRDIDPEAIEETLRLFERRRPRATFPNP